MISIAFTGQDGTGKSTQADRLEARLRADGVRVSRTHQYEAVTPVGRLIARGGKVIADHLQRRPGSGVGVPTRRKLLRRLASVASLGAGWFRAVAKRALHSRSEVLLLDRCYGDEVIRVVNKFGRGRALGLWLLRRAVPRPDLVITFCVEDRVGWERKKTRELSLSQYSAKIEVSRGLTRQVGEVWPVVEIEVDGQGPDVIEARVWGQVQPLLDRRGAGE